MIIYVTSICNVFHNTQTPSLQNLPALMEEMKEPLTTAITTLPRPSCSPMFEERKPSEFNLKIKRYKTTCSAKLFDDNELRLETFS